MDELTPYERTMRRLAGQPVDRIPNQNILMAFAARYIGSTYDRLAPGLPRVGGGEFARLRGLSH
jgi:uroporphyrinogen-III decarboxylase